MLVNQNRISSSILQQMLRNCKVSKFGENFMDSSGAIQNLNTDTIKSALYEAQSTTYADKDPIEVLRKHNYFILGTVFESLLTLESLEDRLVVFDSRRKKVEREYVEHKCRDIGPNALPIKRSSYDAIRRTVSNIHNKRLPASISGICGKSHIIELFQSDIQYQVRLSAVIKPKNGIGNAPLTLTGDCDAIVTTLDGSKLLVEIKTSSKMYYPNHANKIITKSNYDFQMALYAYLMYVNGMRTVSTGLFIIGNPAKGFGIPLEWDITKAVNKFKLVMNLIKDSQNDQ